MTFDPNGWDHSTIQHEAERYAGKDGDIHKYGHGYSVNRIEGEERGYASNWLVDVDYLHYLSTGLTRPAVQFVCKFATSTNPAGR